MADNDFIYTYTFGNRSIIYSNIRNHEVLINMLDVNLAVYLLSVGQMKTAKYTGAIRPPELT